MQITKTQSITVAFLTIGLFIASSLFLIQKNSNDNRKYEGTSVTENSAPIEVTPGLTKAEANTPTDVKDTSEFMLNDFHRVESQNGKVLWEVKAKKGQYFAKNNTAKIYDGTIWVFKKNNNVFVLSSGEADLSLQGMSLDKVAASKGVKLVYNDKLTAESDNAEFSRSENKVFAPNFVTIKKPGMEVTGTELRVDLNSQVFSLAKDVSTVIEPKAK